MEFMRTCPPNYFDLAIVDPPYGISQDGTIGFADKKTKGFTFNKKEYKQKDWDASPPPKEYFDELFRISKVQVIWGANYFKDMLPSLKNFIYWHKKGKSDDSKFNEGEIAFVSKGRSRMVDIWWNGFGTINSGEDRVHPTQKPIALYRWVLKNYAKAGDLILDTHVGSASSLIACVELGFDYIGFEIDKDYYTMAKSRLERATRKYELFDV